MQCGLSDHGEENKKKKKIVVFFGFFNTSSHPCGHGQRKRRRLAVAPNVMYLHGRKRAVALQARRDGAGRFGVGLAPVHAKPRRRAVHGREPRRQVFVQQRRHHLGQEWRFVLVYKGGGLQRDVCSNGAIEGLR